ncbi:amidohydrolase family protein [Agromyces larvae]|uniref:Amidohydrolase-related domain-containing protein n=1 Tax=Agromyces larvae TaxID=2929802 RepID=A0ABY4BW90_9MICO|nr:hypothetical protein [Agromyces larvae]UOE43019.1 hypothetical protein MTO99_12570 [Agromyces larvae]
MPRPAPIALGPFARPARRSLNGDHPGEVGTALPPLVDHHVHLMLAGSSPADGLARLVEGGVSAVVDLGAPLALVDPLRDRGMPRVDFAGPFLTARGGYPLDRPWAAAGSVREIEPVDGSRSALPSPAETAISELHSFGASVVKVVLNADAGPVLDPATLAAIVRAARAHGMPVVAHVEGAGMSRLAIEAGADAMAHTPFTEHVDDELIARAVAQGQRWISTLFVQGYGETTPDFTRAVDNLARFRAAGGDVLYGTDLGNGEQPIGVNPDELAALVRAGLEASDLIAALIDPWPRVGAVEGVATFVPGPPPASLDEVPAWLATARVVPAEELDASAIAVGVAIAVGGASDPISASSAPLDRDVTA